MYALPPIDVLWNLSLSISCLITDSFTDDGGIHFIACTSTAILTFVQQSPLSLGTETKNNNAKEFVYGLAGP